MKEKGIVDLTLSENLYGPSPECLEVLGNYGSLNLYERKSHLISKLSEMFGIGEEHIFTGSGGHGVLKVIFNAKRKGKLLLPKYSWRMFDVFAKEDGYDVSFFEQGEDFAYKHEKIIKANEKIKPDITLICSPNNPTANSIKTKDLEKVLKNARGLVVLDEIYVNFSEKSERESIDLAKEYSNLITVRSFSKGYALANPKIGYGVSGKDVKKLFGYHPNLPLNINGLNDEIAVAALESRDYYEDIWNKTKNDRDKLNGKINEIPGCKAYPSDANFVFARMHVAVIPVLRRKLEGRYKIKLFDDSEPEKYPRFIRIGIGTGEHTRDLIEIFDEIKTEFNPL